jgi:hypothetical protein
MKKITIITIIYFIISIQFTYCQVSFPKKTDEKIIVSDLFEAKWFENDSTNRWVPSISERIKFDSSISDTLRTKIDTIFNYKNSGNDYKIILTKTFKLNDNCHACQPVLGIIELMSNEAKDSLIVTNINKFVTHYGAWGETPNKRSIMQLCEDTYCVKITEYESGMGQEVGFTSFFLNCNKIFSIKTYDCNYDAVEFDYQKYKYASKVYFEKNSKTIKVIQQGTAPNKFGQIKKINKITTFKFDGEFLDKISTINIKK